MSKITLYDGEIMLWLTCIGSRFTQINKEEGLTPEDKKRLKDLYINECVTPRIREAARKCFPEEFQTGQRPGKE